MSPEPTRRKSQAFTVTLTVCLSTVACALVFMGLGTELLEAAKTIGLMVFILIMWGLMP